ncbi:MAG: arsenosugar biosynthesis radical SAM protein ArsS [Nitrospiraceae bacterium]|jgi:radical SAM/Cys-rich protein|nr:MAG: arsenosugar biosynthesis radical SAM protein ArsS [Nitrospiraceae bacterium]
MKFTDKVASTQSHPLHATEIRILQVNLGYRCNLSCKHCHVEGGPERKEVMSRETMGYVLSALNKIPVKTLDITGGAPELNPHFTSFVQEARHNDIHVIVRSNLTIFFEKGMEYLPEFFRKNNVEIIASLPYYRQSTVDRVRGNGTFEKSIDALRILNRLGYGNGSGEAVLNLVYNPQGAFLPASQESLEEEYKKELWRSHDIDFNRLYTFTNMPVGRFKNFLVRTGNLDTYVQKLSCSFNPQTLEAVMCRHILNVGWDGKLYDCDFNQMIRLEISDKYPRHIRDFDYSLLSTREIAVDDHCFGCTAGQGST